MPRRHLHGAITAVGNDVAGTILNENRPPVHVTKAPLSRGVLEPMYRQSFRCFVSAGALGVLTACSAPNPTSGFDPSPSTSVAPPGDTTTTVAGPCGSNPTTPTSTMPVAPSSAGSSSSHRDDTNDAGIPTVFPVPSDASNSPPTYSQPTPDGGALTVDETTSTTTSNATSNDSSSTGASTNDGAKDPVLAFPEAEGFGRHASGGRGGEVVHVTNLNDAGTGPLREAVSKPRRIIVFDVGGVIRLSSRLVIQSHITVAGQTAPGGGITLYGNGIALNGDNGGGNVILRYLRVRMGQNGDSGKDAVSISKGENYMLDHLSISWGRDGTLDVNGTPLDNLSFQDCIVAQGINRDNHSTGGLMQPSGVEGHWSMIRSLYIDNKTRNPKARGRHEFINNVLYNWAEHGYIMGDTTGGESHANVIGNAFIYGPSSNADSHITGTTEYFHLYAQDNLVDTNKNGVFDGTPLTNFKTATLESKPYDYPSGTRALSARDAVADVLEHVGASLVRDEVDTLLIEQLRSYGTQGRIIDTESDNEINGNVGTVAGGTPPTDSDRDGMPDDWETVRGLDPNAPDDAGDDDNDGYTNVEEYLNCLAAKGGCRY